MKTAYFRFYAELNDFLASERRDAQFEHSFEFSPSLKDMIESLGVPHTEIGSVLKNGEPCGTDVAVRDHDQIAVYPYNATEPTTDAPAGNVLGAPAEIRFIADVHLGRLATYLRMLGFDTLYSNTYGDEHLAHISSAEQRILLTMDRGLLKRSIVNFGYFVRAHEPRRQLVEVLRRYRLSGKIREFSRCLKCNSLIEAVQKEEIVDILQPRTREYFDHFLRCPSCGRVYWSGSHYEHMTRFIEGVKSAS